MEQSDFIHYRNSRIWNKVAYAISRSQVFLNIWISHVKDLSCLEHGKFNEYYIVPLSNKDNIINYKNYSNPGIFIL